MSIFINYLNTIKKRFPKLLFVFLLSLCGCSGFPWNGTLQPLPSEIQPSLIPSLQPGCLENNADFSNQVQDIVQKPQFYSGKHVTLTGFFRGWDLLGEVKTSSPVTRSDWVIRDRCGAIYVQAREGLPLDLNAGEKDDTVKVVRVNGFVRVTSGGQAYIEPEKVELVR
jgi:hypothetical protein